MFSTPTVVGELLYIGSCSGNFFALDCKTGEVRWSYDVGQDGAKSFHGSMLVADILILASTDGNNGHVYAFNVVTGEVVWKYHAELGISTDLLSVNSRVYGVGQSETGGFLVCLDLKNGAEIWKIQIDAAVGPPFVINKSPALAGNRIFYGGADGLLYAFNAETGELIWKKDVGAAIVTPVTAHNHALYFGAESDEIFRASLDSGKIENALSVDGPPHGPLTLIGNSIVFL